MVCGNNTNIHSRITMIIELSNSIENVMEIITDFIILRPVIIAIVFMHL